MSTFLVMVACCAVGVGPQESAVIPYEEMPHEVRTHFDKSLRLAERSEEEAFVVAGRVFFGDGAAIGGNQDVHVTFGGTRNARPLRMYPGGWFLSQTPVTCAPFMTDTISIRAFGYDPLDLDVSVRAREASFFEVELRRTPKERLGSVIGVIEDTAGVPIEGVRVSVQFSLEGFGTEPEGAPQPTQVGFTGKDGEYWFEGLAVAQYKMFASKKGLSPAAAEFIAKAGEAVTADLEMASRAGIQIEYAFQADGSPDFQWGDLKRDNAVWPSGRSFDFSMGRVVSHGDMFDLSLSQDSEDFKFYLPDVATGIHDVGDVPFDTVLQAPVDRLDPMGASCPCRLHHVYVVRTYDRRYAKFLVRAVGVPMERDPNCD